MQKEKIIIPISLAVMLAISTLCVVIYKENVSSQNVEGTVTVSVEGKVQNPGVYRLHDGARIADAIALSGGVLETGDEASVNLASFLADGDEITVLAKPLSSENRLNINRATKEDLMLLPGIGEVKAEEILKYREKIGSFSTPEELLDVKGIGEKTLANMKDLLEFR